MHQKHERDADSGSKKSLSVLEAYAGKSVHSHYGQRVVAVGQLVSSASDLYLGWTQGVRGDHFHVRQLKDMKTSRGSPALQDPLQGWGRSVAS